MAPSHPFAFNCHDLHRVRTSSEPSTPQRVSPFILGITTINSPYCKYMFPPRLSVGCSHCLLRRPRCFPPLYRCVLLRSYTINGLKLDLGISPTLTVVFHTSRSSILAPLHRQALRSNIDDPKCLPRSKRRQTLCPTRARSSGSFSAA